MENRDLNDLLIVGAKVKIGQQYAEWAACKSEEVTLVDGYFEYDNGLYTETQRAPATWDEATQDFNSIYHMFGNELKDFMDCEVVYSPAHANRTPAPTA